MNNPAPSMPSPEVQFAPEDESAAQRFSPDWLKNKLNELLKNSPAADLERNVKAVLNQGAQQIGLVTREEFEVRLELIDRLGQRVASLEAELDKLNRVSR